MIKLFVARIYLCEMYLLSGQYKTH